MKWEKGTLLHIHIAPKASLDMIELEEAQLVAGKGLLMIAIIIKQVHTLQNQILEILP